MKQDSMDQPERKYAIVAELDPPRKGAIDGDWWRCGPLRALLIGEDGKFYVGHYKLAAMIKNHGGDIRHEILCHVKGPMYFKEAAGNFDFEESMYEVDGDPVLGLPAIEVEKLFRKHYNNGELEFLPVLELIPPPGDDMEDTGTEWWEDFNERVE